MSITISRSFEVDPPTAIVCTDGEWTISNDELRLAAAGDTCGEAMDGYLKAWSVLVRERLARAVLDAIEGVR